MRLEYIANPPDFEEFDEYWDKEEAAIRALVGVILKVGHVCLTGVYSTLGTEQHIPQL